MLFNQDAHIKPKNVESVGKLFSFGRYLHVQHYSFNAEALISLQVPNYYKIIKHPMDLTQVKRKLQRKHPLHYKSPKEFVCDVRLVFSNCAKFNEVSSGHVFNLCGGGMECCM